MAKKLTKKNSGELYRIKYINIYEVKKFKQIEKCNQIISFHLSILEVIIKFSLT